MKGDGGAVGLTENPSASSPILWLAVVSGPEMGYGEFESLVIVKHDSHHEQKGSTF